MVFCVSEFQKKFATKNQYLKLSLLISIVKRCIFHSQNTSGKKLILGGIFLIFKDFHSVPGSHRRPSTPLSGRCQRLFQILFSDSGRCFSTPLENLIKPMVFKGFYNIRELQGRINLRIAIHWMLFARCWNDASDGLYLLLDVIPLKNNTKP